MLGQIVSIEENTVILKLNIDLTKFQSIVNLFVLLEEADRRLIGEIVDVKDGNAYIHLLGELKGENFVPGVSHKPSFGATVKLVSKERMPMIMSVGEYQEDKHLLLGKSVVYEDIDISVDINGFFSNHFAIFGSTGSGKSCSVARIFQNLFEKKNSIPYRASIFIFDAYGEYHQAFSKLHEITPELNFKAYTTNLEFGDSEILRIPLWLMDVDDIAILLGAEKASQLPILEKALKFVTVFAQEENVVIKYKNDVIARALLDILSSGRAPAQIRDQVTSVLTSYNTKDLNLETTIYQPGYSRPLKQCLFIDATGKIRDMELLINFLDTFLDDNLELKLPEDIVYSQPFPGPGLAVRILGDITEERVKILQEADDIVVDEIKHAGLYRKLWQSFAILLPVKSVGVMGDGRTYEQVCAIRAVESVDAMTADWAKIDYNVLGIISNRIINEVKGINRVVYDISSKPPATIEWE